MDWHFLFLSTNKNKSIQPFVYKILNFSILWYSLFCFVGFSYIKILNLLDMYTLCLFWSVSFYQRLDTYSEEVCWAFFGSHWCLFCGYVLVTLFRKNGSIQWKQTILPFTWNFYYFFFFYIFHLNVNYFGFCSNYFSFYHNTHSLRVTEGPGWRG